MKIGFFDSGIGGLTTLAECIKILPRESYIYYADNALIPYGNKPQKEITDATLCAFDKIVDLGVKSLVVACNTATSATVGLMREKHPISVLGIEPALKPATEKFFGKKIVVLCTVATSRQRKFHELCERFGTANIVVVPCETLAQQVEENVFDLSVLAGAIRNIFKAHLDAAAVVLGCTHYVFLKNLIERFFKRHGENPTIFDGNNGVARHLKNTLSAKNLLCDITEKHSSRSNKLDCENSSSIISDCTNSQQSILDCENLTSSHSKTKLQIICTKPNTTERYHHILEDILGLHNLQRC